MITTILYKRQFFIFTILLLTSIFSYGQAHITIEVSWGGWSSENRVTFRDASDSQIGDRICNPVDCFDGSTNTPYNNLGSPESYLAVPFGTNYDLFLEDDYGDGWNGTSYVRVYQDGILILNTTLAAGFNTEVSFDIVAPSPTLSINDESLDETDGNMIFTVTHTGGNAAGAFTTDFTTINGSATAGSDYVVTSGTLSFSGTVGDTEQITVPISDDFILEGDETFTVQFSNISDLTVNITDIATGTILDDESDPALPRDYEERFTKNLNGDFLMRGNTNLECISGCPATPTTNNGINMGYSDIDADPVTINSSNNTFNIPAGASVQWAGLYWGGSYNSTLGSTTNPPGTVNIDQVKFKEPGAVSYTAIAAQERNIVQSNSGGGSTWRTFMSYADVTGIVQSAGGGVYTVADIALITGSGWTGPFGGWNMVVVYKDPALSTKNIAIWDGFDFFGFGASSNFTVTGLLTPDTGTFQTHAGYFGFDGEASNTGDFVNINGTALSNALNPNDNTLNGTISEFGIDMGGRSPSFAYSWGVDSDVFDATGLVANSATSAAIDLGSAFEGIWGGVFVISNEIAFPAVSSKSFSPPVMFDGDESTVTIVIDNPSKGVDLTNFALTDNFPAGMMISPTPDATSSSGGTITAIPGATNFIVSGLNVIAGTSCSFTFDVVTSDLGVYENIVYPDDTSNDQDIPFSGESSGTLTVKVRTVITNRRITYRVNKN